MNRVAEQTLRIVDIVLSFALAVTVVYLGYVWYWQSYNSVLLAFLLILGGLFSSFVCKAFHELGHILFGSLCGFRFNSVRIGFMNICRRDGKLKIFFSTLPDSIAGATEMLPKDAKNLYPGFLATVSGGLVFSFLFLVACAVTLFLYRLVPFAAFILVCTGLPYAFHLFFYNVLPFNDDNLDTDGGMLRGLIKKETSYLTAINILAIEGYLYQGLTPAQIDKQLYFGLPQLPEDDVNFILLTSYRLMYYLDSGDIGSAIKASDRLEGLTEYIPKFYYNQIATQILFCTCCLKGDIDSSREKYKELRQYLLGEKTLQTYRTCAAYELYVNRDKMAALHALSAAQQRAEECDIEGVRKYERKLISCLRADIDELNEDKAE